MRSISPDVCWTCPQSPKAACEGVAFAFFRYLEYTNTDPRSREASHAARPGYTTLLSGYKRTLLSHTSKLGGGLDTPATPNPYAPPRAALAEPSRSAGNVIAVLVGAAIGAGVAYVVLSLCSLVLVWVLFAQGVPSADIPARAYEATGYLAFAHVIAFVCGLPGGYWSARLSASRWLRNAILGGVLVSLFTLLLNLVPYYVPIPLWSRAMSLLTPVPAFIVGAWWWRTRGHRSC